MGRLSQITNHVDLNAKVSQLKLLVHDIIPPVHYLPGVVVAHGDVGGEVHLTSSASLKNSFKFPVRNSSILSTLSLYKSPGLVLHVWVPPHGGGVARHRPLPAEVDLGVCWLRRVGLSHGGQVEAHLLALLVVRHHHGHRHVNLLVWRELSQHDAG